VNVIRDVTLGGAGVAALSNQWITTCRFRLTVNRHQWGADICYIQFETTWIRL